MNRRTALRHATWIAIGATIIPSCMEDTSKSSILLKKLKISQDEEKLITRLADLIIPKTDTPGAVDVGAHFFVLKMADDCMNADDQRRYLAGLSAFRKLANKSSQFLQSPEEVQVQLVASLNKLDDQSDLAYFYQATKNLVIQGYASSKYFLTNVQVYELVPARYYGCVPVQA